jgi:hypothetical protein
MLRKILILLISLLTAAPLCFAQKENQIWAFGINAGIDFRTGSPVAIKTGITSLEGSAVVCDPAGELLFYTNGDTIWNRDHQIMPNGVLFPGRATALTFSTSQPAVIVPVPDNEGNRYYVFSLETNVTLGGTLYYSIVDMNLDNGRGDVVANSKAVPIDVPSVFKEKMIAVAGEDCDIWLILRSHNANTYKSFRISDTGIDQTPVVSTTGTLPVEAYTLGVMKASPDRRRLAVAANWLPFTTSGGIELYDFDPATGILSNAANINVMAPGNYLSYGIEFSPDGSRLYALLDSLYQYNLALSTTADIAASKTRILAVSAVFTDLKRGPDGKIYFSRLNHDSLHCIENPNALGLACNPVLNAVPLVPGTKTQYGFPNYLSVAQPKETAVIRHPDTLICLSNPGIPLTVLEGPQGYFAYEWENGDTARIRTIYTAGTYRLHSKDRCAPRVDSFVIRGGFFPPLQLSIDGQTLSTTAAYDSWQWYRNGQPISGATDSVLTVASNGVYSVKVSLANGCSDSASYSVTNVSVSHLQTAGILDIYPNPAHDEVILQAGAPFRNADLRISDLVGNTVLTHGGLSGNLIPVHISQLPAGVYLIRIQDGRTTHHARLVKQ